jgi:hypothetical protein
LPSSSWPDLPLDLAGLVLCRLNSHEDRISFGAVCRDWRLAVQRQRTLPGTTPWLNLGLGVYQSLDGEVHRFFCHGSSGCWILYYHDPTDTPEGGGRCLFLRNPLHASSASIEMMWPCKEVSKIVLCSLSVAAILHRGVCVIAPCWPSDMSRPWEYLPWWPLMGGDYADMAFFRGKIFTVTLLGDLISHDVFSLCRENVLKSSLTCNQPVDSTACHLVVSADKEKLLMVRLAIVLVS